MGWDQGDRETYERDGYVVRRGILGDDVLEPVREVFADAVDRLARSWVDDGLIADAAEDADFDHRWARLREQLPARFPTAWRRILASRPVYDLWQEPELADVAADLFGEELIAHSIWNGRPRDAGNHDTQRIEWHQDAHYYKAWDQADGGLLSVWIPLVPVDAESGCLQVIPGSHRGGLLPQIRGANGLRTVEARYVGDDPVTLEMQPGDVFYFSDLTLHRALDNVSDRVRWSIDVRFGEHTPAIWSKSQRGYVCRSADPARVESFDTWIQRYDYDLAGLAEEVGVDYGGLDADTAAAVLGTSRVKLRPTDVVGVKGQVQQRGVERRAAIVDAALALFSEIGYRSGGLTALADRVGVTAPAILHHFGSKDNLLEAVIAEADRRWRPLVDEIYEPGGLESIRRLRVMGEAMEKKPNLPALHLRLEVERCIGESPVAESYFLKRARGIRYLIAEAIVTGQRRGEIRDDVEPVELAEEIHAFIDGAARAWLVDPKLSLTGLLDRYLTSVEERIAVVPRDG